MNKRIKLKKGILHKKCDEKCWRFRAIRDCHLYTNVGCENCKFADEMWEKLQEKYWR